MYTVTPFIPELGPRQLKGKHLKEILLRDRQGHSVHATPNESTNLFKLWYEHEGSKILI